FRTTDLFYADERPEGRHVAPRTAHVKPFDILYTIPVLRVGLHQNFPCSAEAVEIVDIQSAKKRLQRIVDIAHRNAERLRFVDIHADFVFGNVVSKCADDVSKFGALPRGRQEFIRSTGQIGNTTVAAIFQHQLKPAGSAEPEYRR